MVQISLINCLLFLNISVLSVIWLYTKNLLFWTLQKSNQYFVFKTTYLLFKVIVPKHKNWRWIPQRAFQDPSSYVCPESFSLPCLPAPNLRWVFELVPNTLSYRSRFTPNPQGWQREVQHGFKRGHVPCLDLPANNYHSQLVTTGSTVLTWGYKGAQICSSTRAWNNL